MNIKENWIGSDPPPLLGPSSPIKLKPITATDTTLGDRIIEIISKKDYKVTSCTDCYGTPYKNCEFIIEAAGLTIGIGYTTAYRVVGYKGIANHFDVWLPEKYKNRPPNLISVINGEPCYFRITPTTVFNYQIIVETIKTVAEVQEDINKKHYDLFSLAMDKLNEL